MQTRCGFGEETDTTSLLFALIKLGNRSQGPLEYMHAVTVHDDDSAEPMSCSPWVFLIVHTW